MNLYLIQIRTLQTHQILLKSYQKRELEILPLIAKGYGNKEIAEKLFVSVKTVEAHKTHIMTKLGLKSKPELVEYALKKKLLEF